MISRLQLLKTHITLDFSITLFSNIGITFLGALGGIITARILGPEGRGELATATVWMMLLSAIAQIGLSQALTYSVAREPNHVGDIFVTVIRLWAVQSVLVLLVGLFLIQVVLAYSQPNAVEATRIYLLSAPPAMLSTYLQTITRGLKRFPITNGLRIGGAVSVFGALLLALIGGTHGARQVALLIVITQSLTAVMGLIACRRLIILSGTYSRQRSVQLLKYGSKSLISDVAHFANYRLDQFIMSLFLPLNQLGYYAVGVSYASILLPLSNAFQIILFPVVAGETEHIARKMISKTLAITFVTSFTGAVAMALFSPYAIPLLFGHDFTAAVNPTFILLIATILFGCNAVLADGLRGLGHPLSASLAELSGVGVTIVGLLWALPQFGIMGAAFISLATYGTVTALLYGRFLYLRGSNE